MTLVKVWLRWVFLGNVFLGCWLFNPVAIYGQYPDRPVTIINSNKPGGVIDVMSRKLAAIATKYADITIVVENVPGGSGTAAMNYVLNKPADGYTLLASLKSFISTSLMSESGISLQDFHLVAALVNDWEALITSKNSTVVSLEDIINDAQAKNGRQKWLGPNTGGMDHLMALKTWASCSIQARWIPFEGSSLAIAALLGGNGVVYVGNPIDIQGRPDLHLAAVAAPERLPDFPDVPTFKEEGFALEEQMWRGFSVKKGTPQKEVAFLEDLFYKISQDPEWQSFIKAGYAEPVFVGQTAMATQIEQEEVLARELLTQAGIITDFKGRNTQSQWTYLGVFLLGGLIITIGFYRWKGLPLEGTLFLFTFLLGLPLYFLFQTFSFPSPAEANGNGPALIPRIWAVGMVGLTLVLLFRIKPKFEPAIQEKTATSKVGLSLILLLGYTVIISLLGFYLSSAIFIMGMLWQLNFRRPVPIVLIVSGFLALIYLLFEKGLHINLPTGSWI